MSSLRRKIEFIKSWNIVEKHNKRFKDALEEYDLELNFFADMSRIERLSLSTGNVVPEDDITVIGRVIDTVTPTTFPPGPASIDWTTSNCIAPVKDQGYICNNCWAFSTIAALEAHWCLKKGQPTILSEQQLIDCNRNSETGNWGCDGGNQASAYTYIAANGGISSLSSYPYQEADQHTGIYPCRYISNSSNPTCTGYWRIRPYDETTLKNSIAANGYVKRKFYPRAPLRLIADK